jgi:hypothetical protein
MSFSQALPRVGLGLLGPRQQVGKIERAGAVVLSGIALSVQPTVGAQVLANFCFEVVLLVQIAHALPGSVLCFCNKR